MSIYTIRYRHIKREFLWRPREIEKLRHMMEKMPVLIFRLEIPYSESINVDRGNFFLSKQSAHLFILQNTFPSCLWKAGTYAHIV